MRSRFFMLLPLTLSISLAAQANSLPEAIQQALEMHPEVQAEIHGRMAADRQLRAAKGRYLPTVSLSAGYGREGTDSPTTRAGSDDHWRTLTRGESSLQVRQRVFDGFATQREVGRLEATVNSRAFGVLSLSERTALTVTEVYLDVLKREERVALAEDNLRNHERIYDQISMRQSRGVGRMADLDQAEARLALSRNNLITERTNLDDARVNYYSVVGAAPVSLTLPEGQAMLLPENLEAAKQALLQQSPVLGSAHADITATEMQYDAAKSALYSPTFDLELARAANNNIDGQRGHVNEWQIMLRMNYNLYSGGADKANLEARAFEVNQAMDIRNNALRVLNEELELSWNALNNAREQLPNAQRYVDYSTRVREGYQQQFSIGERTLLDMLDSENELLAARQRFQDVLYTELFTQYRIKAVMGELLKSQGVVAPMAAVVSNDVRPQVELPGLN
ncbi:MAG: TolC family outer membrane protein [Pseudomonas sp.]